MDDRLRPRYHLTPSANWMNDPNGLIHWKGVYHLFYQYTPDGAFSGQKYWGHATSVDSVRWEHLPVALSPDPDSADEDGCWSGVAVVDGDRVAFVYSGNRDGQQRACIAYATDESLETWEKHAGNPVIPEVPTDLPITMYRDHSVWREGETWFQVIGAGIAKIGGGALLYRSPDLIKWEYLGPILVEDPTKIAPEWSTNGWECPDFFALGDRHVLTISLWGEELRVGFYSGSYANFQFSPTNYGLLDSGMSFYAPQSFFDASGRRVMFGWLREECSAELQLKHGWTGAMSLPRVLDVDASGSLIQTVAPEVDSLRGEQIHLDFEPCDWFRRIDLGSFDANAIEIDSEWAWGDQGLVGINLCSSAGEQERSVISLSMEDDELVLDTTGASLEPEATGRMSRSALGLIEGETVRVRVFVDVSVIEVVVNDRTWITSRVYPTAIDQGQLHVSSTVPGRVDIWQMTRI